MTTIIFRERLRTTLQKLYTISSCLYLLQPPEYRFQVSICDCCFTTRRKALLGVITLYVQPRFCSLASQKTHSPNHETFWQSLALLARCTFLSCAVFWSSLHRHESHSSIQTPFLCQMFEMKKPSPA